MASPSGSGSDKSSVVREFAQSIVLYQCAGRNIRLACLRVLQKVMDGKTELEPITSPTYVTMGSFWEGIPRQVCGDADCMVTHATWPFVGFVNTTPERQRAQKQWDAVAEDLEGNPGFLRVRVPSHVRTPPVIAVTDGYINSASFVIDYMKVDSTKKHNHVLSSSTFGSVPEEWKRNLVPCLFCPDWPPCTDDFFARPRDHGWPSPKLLTDVKEAGCHVVSKPSPDSEIPDLEFMWAFPIAERLLFHSMNDTQAACMYLLKCIKEQDWNEESDPKMSSYVLKNACFWTFEQNELSNDVFKLTTAVIDWLIISYRNRNLPHYFISKQNLIRHAQDSCDAVVAKLSSIKEVIIVQTFSSVRLAKPIQDIVKSLATEIQIPFDELRGADDYKKFFDVLGDCDRGQMLLNSATKSLHKGDNLYKQKELRHLIYELEVMRTHVSTLMGGGTPDPIDLPEKVIQPILQDLGSFVPESLAKPIEVCIHGSLGEIYLECVCEKKARVQDVLYKDSPCPSQPSDTNGATTTPPSSCPETDTESQDTTGVREKLTSNQKDIFHKACVNIIHYLRKQDSCYRIACALVSQESIQKLQSRAEDHYRLAFVPLESPDGTTDGCFVGRVGMAILFYVTEQSKELENVIQELMPFLSDDTIREWGIMKIKAPRSLQKQVMTSFFYYYPQREENSPILDNMIPIPASVTARKFLLIWAAMRQDRALRDKARSWQIGSWNHILQISLEGRGQPIG